MPVKGSAAAQGPMSPAWESIEALRHILLMLCHPFHAVTAYEARFLLAPVGFEKAAASTACQQLPVSRLTGT